MAILRDRNDDVHTHEVHTEKPIIIKEKSGWGWLVPILLLLLIALVASNVFDFNFSGDTFNDGASGGVDVRLDN
ncbi:MAG: hypothetical protein A3J48_03415 [Candidatus Doudnabacteria bacterium RIFCSPHIGHO2_02_FULL_46_11]|uniref:Uncharacterized protein n=1 Tax=Candidatus Doudnabacteria bacterium RIFCSPHIGHO2_02_FULL_46_11 TaxID=1817832 RepID=A0A1F5P4X2_9BACT|nr:MAG: hypothetical protein A3J48_03415 [Candidatus Doudnabacteria bacterium RIFCSPHIGHO2_02_FULL_46_11]